MRSGTARRVLGDQSHHHGDTNQNRQGQYPADQSLHRSCSSLETTCYDRFIAEAKKATKLTSPSKGCHHHEMRSYSKKTAAILSLVSFVVACNGESPSRKDNDSGSDLSTVADLPNPAEGVVSPDSGTCSPEGISTTCDPSDGSGCTEGQCYLTSQKGLACVCPAGVAATGDSCNTTIECAPGNVCAGTSPPGACRALCDPNDPQCDTQETCTPITAWPEFGYCAPN